MRLYLHEIRKAERWCDQWGYNLNTISATAIAHYADTRPNTNSTRRAIRASLKHFWEITGRNNPPLAALRVPKQKRMVCKALNPDDARCLARFALRTGGSDGLAVLLAMYLGLRREEIATLRWSDFRDDGWFDIVGKGNQEAELPVHPILLEALRRFGDSGTPYIFPGRLSDHASPATIWHWTRNLTAAAGLGRVPPHRLRHTCIATGNDNTGDLRAAQAFARHAKPETTSGYTRATAARLTAVMASLDYLDDAS